MPSALCSEVYLLSITSPQRGAAVVPQGSRILNDRCRFPCFKNNRITGRIRLVPNLRTTEASVAPLPFAFKSAQCND